MTDLHLAGRTVVLADPAGRALWGEHKKAPWKYVSRHTVVAETVDAIERRAELTTVPRTLTPAAKAAGLVRGAVERIGFPDSAVRTAVTYAERRDR